MTGFLTSINEKKYSDFGMTILDYSIYLNNLKNTLIFRFIDNIDSWYD